MVLNLKCFLEENKYTNSLHASESYSSKLLITKEIKLREKIK